MESSQSVDIRTDPQRVGLYFDQYQYKITAYIDGIEYFRYVYTHGDYLTRLGQSAAVYSHRPRDPHYQPIRTLVARYVNTLEQMFLWINGTDNREYKRAIAAGKITFYTNNVQILQELKDIFYANSVAYDVYRVEQPANFERGVIYHKQPKHAHRVYFTARRWPIEERTELRNFLAENPDDFFPSRSLHEWCWRDTLGNLNLTRPRWSNPSLFFDIDDDKYAVYFTLRFANTVGKVCRIEKR